MSEIITADAPVAAEAPKTAPVKTNKAKAKPKAAKKAAPSKAKAKAAPSANGHVRVLSGLAASNPKWEGKTCNFRRDGALTARQVDVLGVLAKRSRPASAADVADALKLPEASRKTVNWAIGAIRTEHRDPFALLSRGLVKHVPLELDGRTEHLFEIKAAGRVALKKAKDA